MVLNDSYLRAEKLLLSLCTIQCSTGYTFSSLSLSFPQVSLQTYFDFKLKLGFFLRNVKEIKSATAFMDIDLLEVKEGKDGELPYNLSPSWQQQESELLIQL